MRTLWLVAGISACAASRTSDSGNDPRTESLEGALPKDDQKLDLTDAALIASGFDTETALREARAEFERLIGPLAESLKSVPEPVERARLLLQELHKKGGPLSGKYDARATTLKDVLDRRAFNCVSSAVVYNVVAERIGLDVRAQLLPTHARSLMSIASSERTIVVETTSPRGFDPDAGRQREILRAVAGPSADENARSLVSGGGANVTTVVLIGTIYVNRASIAQEGGDLERAERLFERGEAFAVTDEMRQVLRDQRAALLSQLGADDIISGDPTRYARAYRTLKAAVKLDPREPRIRGAVFQNLRAAAERVIASEAGKGDETSLLSLAGEAASFGLAPAERSGLRAFALSEVARLRIDANKFDEAVDAIEQALREQLGPPDSRLKATLEQNRVAALRLAAITSAKHGDYEKSVAYLDRLEASGALTSDQRTAAEQDRLRVVHIAGNKLIDERQFEKAVTIYREGVRRFPTDPNARHNLVAVLERLAIPFSEEAKCAEAEPYLTEIQSLDPSSTFPEKARTRCLTERAARRLEANDYPEAVSLMRAALEHQPSDASIKKNLAVALMRWASDLSKAGDCKTAKKLLGEVRSLDVPELSGGSLDGTLGGCG